MSKKNVYEVFNEFKMATSKQERIDVLRRNDSWALRNILIGTLSPAIKFNTDVPKYQNVDVPPGMSYETMTGALNRAYLFEAGNPKAPPALTDKRRTELLIQLLESLEPNEAEVFANMIKKDIKVPHLTAKLANEAFPGILPE